MPIIRVDEGLNKGHIKKIIVGTVVAIFLLSCFIMRVQIEEKLASVLWKNNILPTFAIKLYSWAANDGSLASQAELGHILRQKGFSKDDNVVGITWLRTAAEQGDMKSMYDLGAGISTGYIGSVKPDEGIFNIETALKSGYVPPKDSPTNYYLAKGYLQSEDPTKTNKISSARLEKAREYAEKSYLNKEAGSEEVLIYIYSNPSLENWSEEQRLLKVIEYQKSLLAKGQHLNGAIALTYNQLFSKTSNQEYRDKTVLYANKAKQDPLDLNAKYFKTS